MKNSNPFTNEQIIALNSNPYTHNATATTIRYTLEFKEFFYEKLTEGRLSTSKIFEAAGYDPQILGSVRMESTRKTIMKEAKSPEGFKPPRGLSYAEEQAQLKANAEKAKNSDEKIQYLESRVEKLEAELAFVKKTASIRNQIRNTPRT